MTELEELLDHHRIVAAITELFVATDRRDWRAVEACFAPQVVFDMASAGGGPERAVTPAEIAAGWQKGLAHLAAIHHQAGNFQVRLRGDEADASCYGVAWHFLPNPSGRNTRTFVGTYDVGLRRAGGRWRITLFRFRLKFLDGNPDLERAPSFTDAG